MSWVNPRNVNCADLTPPPTIGRPSSTRQRYPALARYAAAIRLLCPAPATTISNRSAMTVCRSDSQFTGLAAPADQGAAPPAQHVPSPQILPQRLGGQDRKSTRLNSSHLVISYAVFCLKKKRRYYQA